MNSKEHWDAVYASKSPEEVSWFQRQPARSLDLIRRVAPRRDAAIIDVGGGASMLVDALLASGYTNITVSDIAAAAEYKAVSTMRQKWGYRGQFDIYRALTKEILDRVEVAVTP